MLSFNHVNRRINQRATCRATYRPTTIVAFGFSCLIFFFIFDKTERPARAADLSSSSVVCRPEMKEARRVEIAARLRVISGFADLHFDDTGALRLGEKFYGGSATARELLRAAVTSERVSVLEDASNRADVVFCRVVEGRWAKNSTRRPPVQVVLIDFADFAHTIGDDEAHAAFNVGWGVLHELAHIIYDMRDGEGANELGAYENLINRMRRECGVVMRARYFYAPMPGLNSSEAKTQLVRLAFEDTTSRKRKLYWLMWDMNLIGGTAQR